MGMPGISELLIIFAVIMLLFGGKKLPELGKALGESIRNFQKGIKETDTPSSGSGTAEPSRLEGSGESGERALEGRSERRDQEDQS